MPINNKLGLYFGLLRRDRAVSKWIATLSESAYGNRWKSRDMHTGRDTQVHRELSHLLIARRGHDSYEVILPKIRVQSQDSGIRHAYSMG